MPMSPAKRKKLSKLHHIITHTAACISKHCAIIARRSTLQPVLSKNALKTNLLAVKMRREPLQFQEESLALAVMVLQ